MYTCGVICDYMSFGTAPGKLINCPIFSSKCIYHELRCFFEGWYLSMGTPPWVERCIVERRDGRVILLPGSFFS